MQENKQEKSQIKQNILLFLEKIDVTPYECYKNTGITRGILSQNNGISEDNLAKFLNYYKQVDIEWLLTSQGNMFKTSGRQDISSIISGEETIIAQKAEKGEGVPLIPVEAMAGYSNGDRTVMEYELTERYFIPDFENKGVKYLIRASGSSMYPKYSNGDILACRPVVDLAFFQWGKVYVLDTEQGPLVKRLFPCHNDPDYLECRSDNKEHYPPFRIPRNSIRKVAIVVGVIRLE